MLTTEDATGGAQRTERRAAGSTPWPGRLGISAGDTGSRIAGAVPADGAAATRRAAERIAGAARRELATAVRAGTADYRRETMLPRLIAVGPAELADDSADGRRRILALLARALRSERRRGHAGHWSYDLNRHIGLRQAMLAEAARVARRPAAVPTPV